MERIIVAFPSEEARRRIQRMLESEGYAPLCCAAGSEAIRAARKHSASIIVCGFHLRDMTATDLAASLIDIAALLVVSTAANLDFCEGENLFKLATPSRRADFFASLELLRKFELKNRRAAQPRQEEDQRLIRRAKELMMEINRMTETEAHRFLQKRSMDTGAKLTETARIIVASYTHEAM